MTSREACYPCKASSCEASSYEPVVKYYQAYENLSAAQGTAVVGGQLLAMRISQRTVAISGGVMFLLFAANSVLTSAE